MTAMVIAISNHKGGVGKTMASMELAGVVARRNHSVLVVDADELQTATRWAAQADDKKPFPAPVVGLAASGGKIHREVRRFVETYEFIVVDCPPSVMSPIPQSVFLIADLVIIPTRPSLGDIWGVKDTLSLVDKARIFNDGLKSAVLLNGVQSRTNLANDSSAALKGLNTHVMTTALHLRQAYAQSLVLGRTVFDVAGRGAKCAREEVESLYTEVMTILCSDSTI